ncbi:MAG: Ribonuclease H [Parcubacteria group bacterium GW2011_GWF2_39_13b]|nr:MAG: Ribonuclease H [Parcubacteria group bacterium GW2011_GWF2_39_13b]
MKLIIYTDGGARGNPGPAATGVVIAGENSEPIKKYSEYLGEKTNNEAEYQAIIFALKKVKALYGKDKIKAMKIEVRSDSELIVRQLNHQYKIEEEHLQKLFMKIWNMLIGFGEVKFVHIPREENKEADKLVNECLDGEMGKKTLF